MLTTNNGFTKNCVCDESLRIGCAHAPQGETPTINGVRGFRNRNVIVSVSLKARILHNPVRRVKGTRAHWYTLTNAGNISGVDVTQPYNPRLRQLHFCPQCTSIRIIYGDATLSDSHRARAIWHARPFSWMGTARGPSGGRMNEIVNIIDRRAGVGRPVRTGKQKQAERGARRERRGVLYAAGVGSRSSPFYHPKSLDSIFLSLFLFFFPISRVSTCFQIYPWYYLCGNRYKLMPSTQGILVTRFSSYIFLYISIYIYERRGTLKHIVHELFILSTEIWF